MDEAFTGCSVLNQPQLNHRDLWFYFDPTTSAVSYLGAEQIHIMINNL